MAVMAFALWLGRWGHHFDSGDLFCNGSYDRGRRYYGWSLVDWGQACHLIVMRALVRASAVAVTITSAAAFVATGAGRAAMAVTAVRAMVGCDFDVCHFVSDNWNAGERFDGGHRFYVFGGRPA